VIAIPEREVEPAEIAERLRASQRRGKTHALVVIAEGAKRGVAALMQYYSAEREGSGLELRLTRLGHVVRGGTPTAADRVLATRLGAAAAECLAAGRHGVLVGMARGEIAETPLAGIAGRTRPADPALVDLAREMAR
jgi:6-phosphofructokinase 1